MKKLYISDLDGTLLNNNAVLSDFTKAELNRLISDENVYFTVATARNVNTIRAMFEGVKLNLPVIEFNGAFITDINTGNKLLVNNISDDITEGFMKLCEEYAQFPLISGFDGKNSKLYYKDGVSLGMDLYLNDRRKSGPQHMVEAGDDKAYEQDKIVCYTLINTSDKLNGLVEALNKEYGEFLSIYYDRDIYYTDWHWASIYSSEAKKGRAIRHFQELFDLEDCTLTVFGDHNNDADMFNVADVSVAVANAQDSLKEQADVIIGFNIEDSVVKYISKDIMGEEGVYM